jgi:hypothetical protein
MRAISLHQPYATLISLGEKHFETRSWGTRFRGPVAIHASKGFPGYAQCAAISWPFREVLHEHGLRVADLPFGAVVATCVVVDCRRIDPADPQVALDWFKAHAARHDQQFGDYTLGRFMWLLSDVVALPEPIPARGALGLWEWDEVGL